MNNNTSSALPCNSQWLPLVGVIILFIAGCTEPNTQDLRQFVADTKANTRGEEIEPLPEIEPYQPATYTAQGLKDPFELAEFAVVEPPIEEPEVFDYGLRPDPNRPREELEKHSLGSLKMVGTIQRDGLWALIRDPDGVVHRVREDNYLGSNHGRIVAVTEQRIELIEIIPEGSGWVERDNFLSLTD